VLTIGTDTDFSAITTATSGAALGADLSVTIQLV
jgi:hypothetical protein